jgi:hypothetical protein
MIPAEFAKRFFMIVIIPRAIWKIFLGSVFLTLVQEVKDFNHRSFIAVLGTGIILGAVFGVYRSMKVLFADGEQVTKSVQ